MCARGYGRRSDALHMFMLVRRVKASAIVSEERERERERRRQRERERDTYVSPGVPENDGK